MKCNKLTRRMFLQGAGSMLPIPFLVSLAPRELWAQQAPLIRRYVALYDGPMDYGRHQYWFPNGSDAQQPSQTLTGPGEQHAFRYASLSSYVATPTTPLSHIFGTNLNPYLSMSNIMRGLDSMVSNSHGHNHFLGGGTIGAGKTNVSDQKFPTVDQALNAHSGFNPNQLPPIVVGASGHSWQYDSSGNVVETPSLGHELPNIYRAVFNDGNFPESGDTATVNPRASLLNQVIEDYRSVRNGPKISREDGLVLQNMMDLLADVERSISSQVVNASCSHSGLTKSGSFYGPPTQSLDRADDRVELMKLITAAFMCDAARVAVVVGTRWHTFQRTETAMERAAREAHNAANPGDQIADPGTITENDHGVSHNPFDYYVPGKLNAEYSADQAKGYFDHYALPLLQEMSNSIDPGNGQSLLYNSLVHLGIGAGQVHSVRSMPTLLVGKAGGSMTTGHYIDYTNRSLPVPQNRWQPGRGEQEVFSSVPGESDFSFDWPGVFHNRLLVTILQKMGLSPSDYEVAGANAAFENLQGNELGSHNNNVTDIGGFGFVSAPYLADPFERGYVPHRVGPLDLRTFKLPLTIPSRDG